MIIEIKDLPNGQSIDKIDIHIDFQKGVIATVTTPIQKDDSPKVQEVPQEMLDAEF